ncbi:MAG TPA: PAS domain-containing sensor histidine kinase [Candidatus Kryptonia bacterium]
MVPNQGSDDRKRRIPGKFKQVRSTGDGKVHISQLRTIPAFVYTADVGSSDFSPKTCVGGFAELTGFSAEQFLQGDFYERTIVSSEDLHKLKKFRRSLTGGSAGESFEYTILTHSGEKIKVSEYMMLLYRHDGHVLTAGLVAPSESGALKDSRSSLADSQLEELRRLNDHLIEANQLKDEFLANTSHELRTPLNSIIGFLTLITEGYYESPEELNLFAHNALESSYHLLNVINDLLDISRIESGKMHLQIERIYVDELLRDVFSSFEIQASQKKLKLDFSMSSTPLFASADLRRIKQVLINVVGNAIKFTAKGGVDVRVEPRDGMLLFSVRDSGIGIEKDKQRRLFQKFVQVEGDSTRRFGGTGLGLAISKHLIEMMGGEIWVSSNGSNKGTTINFTVPERTEEDE